MMQPKKTASHFSDFLDDELSLILSMPVRIGTWAAHMDDARHANHDEKREEDAMLRIISAIHDRTFEGSFVYAVMDSILSRKDYWPVWEAAWEDVMDDLPRAMRLIKDRLPEDEIRAFQKSIYQIGVVVAQAASETVQHDTNKMLTRLMDRLSVRTDLHDPENVSETEKAALKKLLQCLKG